MILIILLVKQNKEYHIRLHTNEAAKISIERNHLSDEEDRGGML